MSRSRGKRSRSQHDRTCAKIRKIVNNSAGDCAISLKFYADFDQVTLDVSGTFKINGSKVKVTALHNVSASKNRYNSNTEKLSKVKLGENYPRAERNT